MAQRNDQVSLRHMLDYSRKAVALIEGRAREDLASDEVLCLALTRVVEIIGEANAGVTGRTTVSWADTLAPDHWFAQPSGARL
jgi:uncharacterized protein with HEPN domain